MTDQQQIDSLQVAIEECLELEVVARNLHTSSARFAELLACALVQRGVSPPENRVTEPPRGMTRAAALARAELERRIGTYTPKAHDPKVCHAAEETADRAPARERALRPGESRGAREVEGPRGLRSGPAYGPGAALGSEAWSGLDAQMGVLAPGPSLARDLGLSGVPPLGVAERDMAQLESLA